MKVNICGVKHKIIDTVDGFEGGNCGMIDHITSEIRINEKLSPEMRKETICHEMVHGMLVHLGYNEQSNDETFVQGLACAIAQGFDIIEIPEQDKKTNSK